MKTFKEEGKKTFFSTNSAKAGAVAKTPNSWGIESFICAPGRHAFRVYKNVEGSLITCVVGSHTYRPNLAVTSKCVEVT